MPNKTCGNCGWWSKGNQCASNYKIPMWLDNALTAEIQFDFPNKDTDATDCECWKEKE